MKNYLLTLFLFVSFVSVAQSVSFPETIAAVKTQDEAKAVAEKLALQLKGKFVFYKIKEFDTGLLRIVYIPEGMDEESIKAQADYEDSFVIDFKAVTNALMARAIHLLKPKHGMMFCFRYGNIILDLMLNPIKKHSAIPILIKRCFLVLLI